MPRCVLCFPMIVSHVLGRQWQLCPWPACTCRMCAAQCLQNGWPCVGWSSVAHLSPTRVSLLGSLAFLLSSLQVTVVSESGFRQVCS